MRCLIFLFFISIQSSAQLINLKKDWFQIDGFFNQDFVKKRNIKKIIIKQSNKLDGHAIKSKSAGLIFDFYPHGSLKKGIKFNLAQKRLDSMSISFRYDNENNLYRKTENSAYYTFAYYYQYNDQNQLEKEIKVDLNKQQTDTLYYRTFDYFNNDTLLIRYTKNDNGKIFQTQKSISKANYNSELVEFSQNQSFVYDEYHYDKEKLIRWKKTESFSKTKKTEYNYKYLNDLLDEVAIYFLGELTYRRAILYSHDQLIKHIIERNYVEQSINIYYFSYEFY